MYVHVVLVLLFSYEALLADKALEWHGRKVSVLQEHMLLEVDVFDFHSAQGALLEVVVLVFVFL